MQLISCFVCLEQSMHFNYSLRKYISAIRIVVHFWSWWILSYFSHIHAFFFHNKNCSWVSSDIGFVFTVFSAILYVWFIKSQDGRLWGWEADGLTNVVRCDKLWYEHWWIFRFCCRGRSHSVITGVVGFLWETWSVMMRSLTRDSCQKYTGCPTRYRTRHFFNNGICVKIK